jgi:2-dehydro-3-deoxygalactonokinase
MPAGASVHLIGAPALCVLYARAIAACGGAARIADADAAAHGLAPIGGKARWN